ncbi:MAG: hypothetical protein ACI8P3_002474 [Saprospiraceae bacterium]|jgi:hypothetical protein
MQIEIDFTIFKAQLQLKKEGGKTLIFDPIRKKYLILLPEELIRQLVLQYLLLDRKFNKNLIRSEQGLTVNELNKRCDILIYDKDFSPFLLVECKSSKVKITQKTFEQIARYNLPLKVKYLLVTNGIQSFCCEMDYQAQSYLFLENVPHADS